MSIWVPTVIHSLFTNYLTIVRIGSKILKAPNPRYPKLPNGTGKNLTEAIAPNSPSRAAAVSDTEFSNLITILSTCSKIDDFNVTDFAYVFMCIPGAAFWSWDWVVSFRLVPIRCRLCPRVMVRAAGREMVQQMCVWARIYVNVCKQEPRMNAAEKNQGLLVVGKTIGGSHIKLIKFC